MAATRGWGYWTEAKLAILSDYLPAFATASKNAGGMVYLALLAGNATNRRRDTHADIQGSAARALAALPDYADMFFFELPGVAAELETGLRQQFPGRTFTVIPGDSNETLAGVLTEIRRRDRRWAPSFAFVDPYSTSALHWATLKALADFKRDRKNKVELWILFYGSDIPRVQGLQDAVHAERLTRTFGSDDWRPIADAREQGVLTAEQARFEYTNLMRWRVERVLGYERTHTLQIKNTVGSYLYDLIFATDNAAGDKIMTSVYRNGLTRSARMRREAAELRREQQSGQSSLFDAGEIADISVDDVRQYRHEAPSPPFATGDSAS